jgi:hypothetical protein
MLSDYLLIKPPLYSVGDLYYGDNNMVGIVKCINEYAYSYVYRVLVINQGEGQFATGVGEHVEFSSSRYDNSKFSGD